MKEKLSEVLINDEFLLINIDDFKNTEDDSFDPDIREFYEASSLPSHIWNQKIMARPEVYEQILNNTKFQKQKLNPNFFFKVFSLIFLEKIFNFFLLKKAYFMVKIPNQSRIRQ